MKLQNASIQQLPTPNLNDKQEGFPPSPIVGTWELDLMTNKLVWSNEQYKIYGYEPKEVEINSDYFIFNTTHPSEIERIKGIISNALKNFNEYSFSRKIIKKSGEIGVVETYAEIIRLESGQPVKITGITVGEEKVENKQSCPDDIHFNELYNKYGKSLKIAILKFVGDKEIANDICQDVFFKVWTKKEQYDPLKGTIYTWMLNIAKNHCKDYLKSKYHQSTAVSDKMDLASHKKMMNSSIDVDKIEVKMLLEYLSPAQKNLLELLFIQGYTQKQVASLKGVPIGTVKTQSRAAINRLRENVYT